MLQHKQKRYQVFYQKPDGAYEISLRELREATETPFTRFGIPVSSYKALESGAHIPTLAHQRKLREHYRQEGIYIFFKTEEARSVLEFLRRAAGWTKGRLAKELGVTGVTIATWEREGVPPKMWRFIWEVLGDVIDVLGVEGECYTPVVAQEPKDLEAFRYV